MAKWEEEFHARHRKHTNIIAIAMIFIAASMMYVSSSFYLENLVLRSQLSNTRETVESQKQNIAGLEVTVDVLQGTVQGLKTEVEQNKFTIVSLSDKLGTAESELAELRPVVKNYYVVGVKGNGEGTVAPIGIKVSKGEGSISVNIKNVDLLAGTQESIRVASIVSSRLTGTDLSKKDIIITFVNENSEVITIDGPSAGSVIAVLMVAALGNKTIDEKVLGTGTIEMSGNIGRVGSIPEKAEAAKEFGATKFLVPMGQKVNVDGIEVVEVGNVNELIALALR